MLVLLDGWMVVRFVGVIRVPLCARVSRVRPVCVPAPPGVFLPALSAHFTKHARADLFVSQFDDIHMASASVAASSSDGYGDHHRKRRSHHRSTVDRRRAIWPESSVSTPAGAALGLDSEREHDRLYRATLLAVTHGLIIGRGRHGVVVALTEDPADPYFSLAVKIVSKVFTTGKGKEPSFHRVVAHTLHLQNEVAAMAKLSAASTFVLQLYCAFQDDGYVYLVMERACCSLKQLIQHADGAEREMLLSFQDAHPLKFLSFGLLTSVALLHACWSMQCARLIHHDIHPAQLLITADGRPRLADLGQCSVRIEEPDHVLASHADGFLMAC